MVWMFTNSGEFSVASTYSIVRRPSNVSFITSCVWHRSLSIKVFFFMLKLLFFKLPLVEELRKFGIQGPSRCFCCYNPQEENMNHVVCNWEIAKQVWRIFEIHDGESSTISTVRNMVMIWWIRPAPNSYAAFVLSYFTLFNLLGSLEGKK